MRDTAKDGQKFANLDGPSTEEEGLVEESPGPNPLIGASGKPLGGEGGPTSEDIPVLRKKPAAAKPAAAALPSSTLSSRACLAILKRLDALGGLPSKELKSLARKVKRIASRSKKVGHEDAALLLGALLARASEALEAEVRRLSGALDASRAAVEGGAQARAEAEERLRGALEAEKKEKAALKEANEAIEKDGKATSGAAAEKKTSQAQIKAMQGRKRQLEETVENVYRPLKEARVEEESMATKRIGVLRKVGKKHGLHPELLSVAPAILLKQLDKRQTFDRLAVESLDAEFAKHVGILASRIEDGEQALKAQAVSAQAKQVALQTVRAQRKEAAGKVAQAGATVRKSREALIRARQLARGLPAALSRAERDFERAKGRVSKFRCGPLAAYIRVLPLPLVNSPAAEENAGEIEEQPEPAA